MASWIDPATEGLEGLNSFFGQVAPILLWIAITLFIIFTVIALAKRFFGETL